MPDRPRTLLSPLQRFAGSVPGPQPVEGDPLKLLFVVHTLPPLGQPLASVGGMQRVAEELVRAFRARPDVDVQFHTLRVPWKWNAPRTVEFLARQLALLPTITRRAGTDVVLFSSLVSAFIAPALKPRMGRTRMASIAHGRDVTLPVPPYQWWLPTVFRSLDALLPVSRATAEACLEREAPAPRVRVCPNGVDPDRFGTPPLRSAARRRLRAAHGLPPDAFVLMSLGRQVRRKGTAWFVRHVLPDLPPRVHYLVAGKGPELDPIRAAALQAGVAARVHTLGPVPEADLPDLFAGSDTFVMPNLPVAGDMEGFGVVLLEAGLAGLPTVAADLEGIRDVILEGVNGHRVASGDAEGFRRTLQRLLKDPAHLGDLSERAGYYTRATFSWPTVVDRYVAVLKEVTGHAPPVARPQARSAPQPA